MCCSSSNWRPGGPPGRHDRPPGRRRGCPAGPQPVMLGHRPLQFLIRDRAALFTRGVRRGVPFGGRRRPDHAGVGTHR
jgi:hypothetical protein